MVKFNCQNVLMSASCAALMNRLLHNILSTDLIMYSFIINNIVLKVNKFIFEINPYISYKLIFFNKIVVKLKFSSLDFQCRTEKSTADIDTTGCCCLMPHIRNNFRNNLPRATLRFMLFELLKN